MSNLLIQLGNITLHFGFLILSISSISGHDVHEEQDHSSLTHSIIASGYSHTLFIQRDGSLWTMGNNEFGQLGDGTTESRYKPIMIQEHGVIDVAAGDDFSLFLLSDGTLWGMGKNSSGQLGDGTTEHVLEPKQIASAVTSISAGHGHSLFIKTGGSLWGMGINRACPIWLDPFS